MVAPESKLTAVPVCGEVNLADARRVSRILRDDLRVVGMSGELLHLAVSCCYFFAILQELHLRGRSCGLALHGVLARRQSLAVYLRGMEQQNGIRLGARKGADSDQKNNRVSLPSCCNMHPGSKASRREL